MIIVEFEILQLPQLAEIIWQLSDLIVLGRERLERSQLDECLMRKVDYYEVINACYRDGSTSGKVVMEFSDMSRLVSATHSPNSAGSDERALRLSTSDVSARRLLICVNQNMS